MPEKNLLAKIREMSPEEKEQLIRKIGQTAYNNEMIYLGCGQSTLAALQQHLNLENPAALKTASGLGGGVARSGEGSCGALTAGVMAIGLICGRDKMEPSSTSASYQEAMELSIALCDRFEEEFGSLRCHDVQKKVFGRFWNMRDPKELESLILEHEKCADVCRKGAELTAKLIFGPLEPK